MRKLRFLPVMALALAAGASLRIAAEVKVNVTEVTPATTPAERARVLATIKGEPITSGDVENSLLPLVSPVGCCWEIFQACLPIMFLKQ